MADPVVVLPDAKVQLVLALFLGFLATYQSNDVFCVAPTAGKVIVCPFAMTARAVKVPGAVIPVIVPE